MTITTWTDEIPAPQRIGPPGRAVTDADIEVLRSRRGVWAVIREFSTRGSATSLQVRLRRYVPADVEVVRRGTTVYARARVLEDAE